MELFYVQIPCYVSAEKPDSTMTANSRLCIPVYAESMTDAMNKIVATIMRGITEEMMRGAHNDYLSKTGGQ